MHKWLHKHLKLAPKHHTGKKLGHKHTSHAVLLILLLVAATVLLWIYKSENGRQANLANDITVSGTIPGPPPTEPPIVDKPQPGDKFTNVTIDVTGHRPGGNIIEIYTNGIFGGAAGCTSGDFSAKVTLVAGKNEIKLRQVDALGQYGPFSEPISVGFLPKIRVEGGVSQFFVVPSAAYFGRTVGQPFKLQASIIGGKAPYAVNINWGDGGESLLARPDAGDFSEEHIYTQPKCYIVTISATDNAKQEYISQTAVYISGEKQKLESQEPGFIDNETVLNLIWPLFIVAFGAVGMFWLGERFQIEEELQEPPQKPSTKK